MRIAIREIQPLPASLAAAWRAQVHSQPVHPIGIGTPRPAYSMDARPAPAWADGPYPGVLTFLSGAAPGRPPSLVAVKPHVTGVNPPRMARCRATRLARWSCQGTRGCGFPAVLPGWRSASSVSMALGVILVRWATWAAMRATLPWHRCRARWFSLGQMAIARRSKRPVDSDPSWDSTE